VITKELRDYIDQALKIGSPPDEIKKRLAGHGWDQSDIDQVLRDHISSTPDSTHSPRYLEPGDHVHVEYAPLSRRLAAFMIDFLILLPLNIFVVLILLAAGREGAPVIIPVQLVAIWFYFALQESTSTQATIGKKLLGLYVVRSYGERINFWRASGRFFATFLSALPAGLGFLWMLTNFQRQTWHDLLTDTVVTIRDQGAPKKEKVSFYTRVGLVAFFILIILPVLLVIVVVAYQAFMPPTIPQNSSPTVQSSVNAESRDATRKSDIVGYASAPGQYFQTHQFYPKSGSGGDTTTGPLGLFAQDGPLKALSSLPRDPQNGQARCQTNSFSPKAICAYHYLTNAAGTTYVLWSILELPGSGGGIFYVDSTGARGLLGAEPTSAP